MSSTLQSQGRVDPILLDGIGFAAPGRPLFQQLPCRVPATGGAYSGYVNAYPLALHLGDANLTGTSGAGIQRQSGSAYARPYAGHRVVQTAYACIERAVAVDIDEQDLMRAGANVDRLRAAQIAPLWATTRLAAERALIAKVFDTSTYLTATVAALTGGSGISWKAAGSTPTSDGLAMRKAVRDATGQAPDYGVISYDVLDALRYHPETLNAKVYGDTADGPAAVIVRDTIVEDDAVLALWARRWKLPNGLFVADSMYNAAMPGQSVSLTDISTAKVAFHCSQGTRGAFQVGNDVNLGAGPASLVIPVEDDFRLLVNPITDPHGEQWTLKHSYGICQPSNMTSTAFVLTACFTSA